MSFWFGKWVGNQKVSEAYLELYAKDDNRLLSVAEASYWEGKDWKLDWECWMHEIDEEDMELLSLLQQDLPLISRKNSGRDKVVWMADEDNSFSIKGCATKIRRYEDIPGLKTQELRRISFVWKIKVSLKVGIFCWRYV